MAPPRSGTTLLFDLLAQAPDLWTIGGESHGVIEGIKHLRASAHDWESSRLTAVDADAATVQRLTARFLIRLRDRDGRRPGKHSRLRLLEKTPRNCLRLPFLATVFPDARFIYLYREPRETISSMLEAWRSNEFVSYARLPGWPAPPWSLLLVPGWRELIGKELPEIVARQWAAAMECLLDDLRGLPFERCCSVAFDRLLCQPQAEIQRLCDWMGVEWDRTLTTPLAPTHTVLTPPAPEKWRRNAAEIERVLPLIEATVERSRAFSGSELVAAEC